MEGYAEIITSVNENGKPTGGYIVPQPTAKELFERWFDPNFIAELNTTLTERWTAMIQDAVAYMEEP